MKKEANYICETENKDIDFVAQEELAAAERGVAVKKKRFTTFRAALVAVLAFTLICGIVYPFIATLIARTIFPYESNGSQIIVTLADGSKVEYGSELIGQSFDKPYYLLGRVNNGAPTNISPENSDHQANMKARLEYLRKLGYEKDGVPQNLLTSSGSGVDPHITPDDADWQVEYLAKNRFDYGWRLVVDADGNAVDYIRLTECEAGMPYAITGSYKTVAMKDEPVTVDGETIYCEEPKTHKLYFKPASVDEGLQVLDEYNAKAYEDFVRGVIDEYTEGRWLWIFGDPTVNVLLVNLALDGLL